MGWFITKTFIIRDCLIISIFSSCRSILLINFQYEKAIPLCVWQWSVLQVFSLDYRRFRHVRWDNKQFRSRNNQCNAEILVEVLYSVIIPCNVTIRPDWSLLNRTSRSTAKFYKTFWRECDFLSFLILILQANFSRESSKPRKNYRRTSPRQDVR